MEGGKGWLGGRILGFGGLAVGSACRKGRGVGEGPFEVTTGEFGARVGRSLSPGLDRFVEEMGCALQSEGAPGQGQCPVCHRPFPQELSLSPLPFRFFQRMVAGGGWWRMKALLELEKPTLILAGKGRSPGTLGCSGRGWKPGALCLKLAGI